MAKFCGSCGAQLSDTAAFCLQCGTAQNTAPQAQSHSPFQSQSQSPFQSQPQPQQPTGVAQGGYTPVNVPGQQSAYTPPQPQTQSPYQSQSSSPFQPQSGSPFQSQPQSSEPAQGGYTPVNAPGQQQAYTPIGSQPPVQYTPVNPSGGPSFSSPPPVVKGSNTGIKIVVGILAVLFVGAVAVFGALFYVGHRVVNKIKTEAAENGLSVPSNSSSSESASAAAHSDFCSMLNKADVGAAVGVPIVGTKASENGCEYMAKGTEADMTARHMSALMAAKGADTETQDKVHQIAGGFFKQTQESNHEEGTDENGMTPVVVFTIDTNGAREQMKLNEKVLGVLGPTGSTAITGIGDEAFDSSGGMMFVRKGDKLARITYLTCPCNTEAIKPLARKLADAM